MNRPALGAAIAALALAIPGVASAQGRTQPASIAVVDTDRLYTECNACRSATTTLQTMVNQARAQAQSLGTPLQTEAQSIQQAAQATQNQAAGPARTAAENTLRQRAQALDVRQNQVNQQIQQMDQNLQSVRANVQRQINERLNPIYTQVMNAHGANLLVDVGATLAHAPALDVTNEVLSALNAALPSVSVTPLPAPPPGAQPQGR